ncbi:hypothetical protein ABS71_03175 [bacterium SCN 62-11]|nr:hypothetical protein [Candidatus Eremiobacteraeota bacterium]ODT76716.1 MAG: hypothetical protein ABS71_03175 [bacterium SCN 62-11]
MRINSLNTPVPSARPFRATTSAAAEKVAVADQVQISGAALPEQRSPLLNPTTQFILGMALHKAVLQGAVPSCLSNFQLGEQSANSQTEVRAHVWQNEGVEGVNSHLQGKVGERRYNGQFYSTVQTAGVNTSYETPYCDFQDKAQLCSRGEDGGAVTRIDGVLDNQEAHLTSRITELEGSEGSRVFRLNTMGELGGKAYQSNTDLTVRTTAGPNGELGGSVTNGYLGDQVFQQKETWTGSKPHAVLNQVRVEGQGTVSGVAVATTGQFTVRDDDNPALSINKLLG